MTPGFALLLLVPAVLTVGDDKQFQLIEDAVAAAKPGDEIDVYPKAGGYSGTAVTIRKAGLSIVGKTRRIAIDGGRFEYSGIGSVPRAIFQIDPGADGVRISNFELAGAHNRSYNGAGVRINQANRVTISECDIHGNDMGVMSNGVAGNPHSAEDQLIDRCSIHHNGNTADPGYNHNLYLGGTSVMVRFSKIDHSVTGHNLKSRAHLTIVQNCVISDSANRELDFVEAWDTARPNSNAVLLGNVIAKDPQCRGNRGVIHFGQEKGRRDGRIYLINNTIRTPFMSAVLALTSNSASARFTNNVIENPHEAHPILVSVDNGASLSGVLGSYNVVSPAYDLRGTGIDPKTLYTDSRPTYTGSDRSRLDFVPGKASYLDGDGKRHDVETIFEHSRSSDRWIKPERPGIGAGD